MEVQQEATKVEVIGGGPLMVYGTINLKHVNGSEELKKGTTAFCRCGKSTNKPFCDGSHNK
jgi:CDGSH-type Zn-finger protein